MAARHILSVECEEWTDYLALREILHEIMENVYFKYKETKAIIAVDRLMHREKRMVFKGYRQIPSSYIQRHMAFFKVEFNPKTRKIAVKQAMLGGDLHKLIDDFYALEKGIRYRTPPLIPKTHKSILTNPHLIPLLEGGARYNSYIPALRKNYNVREPKGEYTKEL
ncbi:MAG: hypothetical protein QXU81_00130 [Candidatus Bathyarchaeia archaeon]